MAEDGPFPARTLDEWAQLARTELRGKPVDSLDWATPEGILVKPLYTAADLEGSEKVTSLHVGEAVQYRLLDRKV